MPYLIGNAVTISTTITTGTPPVATDPSTITLTVYKPDSTVDTFTAGQLAHGGTGIYSYVYLPLTAGGYRYVWTTTVPASASDGTFYVDAASTGLVSLADAKTHLRNVGTADDAQISDFVETASALIQNHPDFGTGPIIPTTYTESHNGGDQTIYVRHAPILSVTTLQEFYGTQAWTLTLQPYGSSVDAFGFSVEDARAGRIVRRGLNGYPYMFPPGVGNVVITYQAGQATVIADVRQATLLLVSHLWETQQSGRTVGKATVPGMAYTLPNRVIEALQGAKRGPSIA